MPAGNNSSWPGVCPARCLRQHSAIPLPATLAVTPWKSVYLSTSGWGGGKAPSSGWRDQGGVGEDGVEITGRQPQPCATRQGGRAEIIRGQTGIITPRRQPSPSPALRTLLHSGQDGTHTAASSTRANLCMPPPSRVIGKSVAPPPQPPSRSYFYSYSNPPV